MHIVGVVCEYNPFHTGHARQLKELRSRGAEAVVCAMSGNFVQRGEAAVLRKHVRAEAAVRGGADLVLELPLPWAAASAESFARGGAETLAAAGVVDTLAFGSECADSGRILRVAALLTGEEFGRELKKELSKGDSFAAARQRAAMTLLGKDAEILSSPNDILGVEYGKALLRMRADMTLLALPRFGPGHDGGAEGDYASASQLREWMASGGPAERYLTPDMLRLWYAERDARRAPVRLQNAERAVLAVLRRMEESDFARYDEGGEGLYRRFFRESRKAAGLEELLDLVKTKRYARARLRRMALAMYLGLLPEKRPERVPYLRVLAMNGRGKALLGDMRGKASVPIVVKPALARKLPKSASELMEAEARATDLYVLAYPELSHSAGGSEWRTGPVLV